MATALWPVSFGYVAGDLVGWVRDCEIKTIAVIRLLVNTLDSNVGGMISSRAWVVCDGHDF